MAKAMFDANNSSVTIIREEVEGEAPITGTALVLEPNSIDNFGNSIESTTRNPLSTSRDAKKGTVTSLNSSVELSQDFTVSSYEEMMSSACSANWIGTNNLKLQGRTILDIQKQDDNWEFKIKKPFSKLPTTAKLIASGFLDERRNGELEIESNNNGIITIKDALEHGFKDNNSIIDVNGKIVVEWADITPTNIINQDNVNVLQLDEGIVETLELGAKVVLDGFTNEYNNGEYIISNIFTASNTVKLTPSLELEDTTEVIPGNLIDIYSGTLTGDSAETVNVTISAAGTYKISIGSITSTVSGSQIIQIQANGTDIVNETKEFINTGDTLNDLEFTYNKTAGQENITTITLVGANLTATNVIIKYQEEDINQPVTIERKMYVSMETRNWNVLNGDISYYPIIMRQKNSICLFQGYSNKDNNGIKEIIKEEDEYLFFKSTTPMTEEKIDITLEIPSIMYIGKYLSVNDNIDENGNLHIQNIEQFNMLNLLLKGSYVWIGGYTPDTQFEDIFANGLVRINRSDKENNILYLDKRIFDSKEEEKHIFIPDTEEQLAAKRIPLYMGQFLRTYPVGHENYKRIAHTIELKTTDDEGINYYEYSVGNLTNTLEIGLPSQEKATLNVNYSSRKALSPTTTPLSWIRKQPKFNKVMSTPTDVLRCRVSKLDESGLSTVWTDATLNINNNVGQEYALGNLAPVQVSQGNLEIQLAGSVFYDSPEVMDAITNNCTISADIFLANEDGGIVIDIPSGTISDGNRDFTNNEKIKQSLTVTAYLEEEWDYSISSTWLPYIPTEKDNKC